MRVIRSMVIREKPPSKRLRIQSGKTRWHLKSRNVSDFHLSYKRERIIKNTLEFYIKVFAKLNILKQTAWKSDIYF